jgi:hypothetical protein
MPDALIQELEHLMLGYGFNFYRTENQLRADDLLIRQRAGTSLGQAAAHLEQLSQQFQRICIPAASREHPYPPAELMERLNKLRRLRQRIMDQTSALHGMSAPAQDKIWQRLRNEQILLHTLLQADIALLQLAAEVEQTTQGLSAESRKSSQAGMPLLAVLDRWDLAIRERQDLLSIAALDRKVI